MLIYEVYMEFDEREYLQFYCEKYQKNSDGKYSFSGAFDEFGVIEDLSWNEKKLSYILIRISKDQEKLGEEEEEEEEEWEEERLEDQLEDEKVG